MIVALALTPNLWLSGWSQTTGADPGKGAASGTTLETVLVSLENGSGINIEIITTQDETAPWVETLSNPARIVVGLPNTVLATALAPITVRTNGVKGVRMATDAAKTTRVVVDLARLCRYKLEPGSGHRLILKLDPTSPPPAFDGSAPGKPGAPVQSTSLLPSQSPPSHSAAGTRNQPRLVEPAFSPKQEAPAADAATPSRDATRKLRKRSQGNLELPGQPAEMQPLPQAVSRPIPPPPPPTLEQLPPQRPRITWDGKQLSIKSENSTLEDILVAVRGQIKTDIEIPPGAAQERVVADLGPGPARDVLTSLLTGSNFDYIIQASDNQENGIQVLLMPRGKNDDGLNGTAVASAPGEPMPGNLPMRKRLAAMVETRNEHSSSDTPPASEAAAAEAGSAGDTPASTGELASSQAGPASPAADGVTSDTASGTGQQIASAADRSTQPAADASPSPFSMQMADLQKMYEERRRLQIQQNQAGAAPPNAQ